MGVGLYMYDVVVKKFTFTISSPDEFLLWYALPNPPRRLQKWWLYVYYFCHFRDVIFYSHF